MQVVISGYYGFNNLGDEAVLAGMLSALRARLPAAEVVVLSADPPITERVHGVRGVLRTGLGVARVLTRADLFLSGGGSLIQDVTSSRSALYYLGVLGLATTLARRTMVFAQGVGPVRRWWTRTLTRRVFDRVHLLTVRDADSRHLLQELGVRQTVHLVADPAFALEPASRGRAEEILWGAARPRLGLALRSWGDNAYLEPLIPEVRALCERIGASVVVLAFHPSHDLKICRRVAEALRGHVVTDVPPSEMMAVVGALDLVVGMRLHAFIFAVAMGVVPVALSYDPKVEGLFRRLGVTFLLPLYNLQPEALGQMLTSAWLARNEVRSQLLSQAATLREDALRAVDLAAALAVAPNVQGVVSK